LVSAGIAMVRITASDAGMARVEVVAAVGGTLGMGRDSVSGGCDSLT
jgi:hypothetical protein